MTDENMIRLKEGIALPFYRLLHRLYRPFLSASHLEDRFQFTVFENGCPYPVGLVSINKGRNTFLQIALIPESMGRGIAHEAIVDLLALTNIHKVGWGCKRHNYPSLKLLKSFEGGLFDNVVKNKSRKSYEGYFRVGKPVSDNMRANLDMVLHDSRRRFEEWLHEYHGREAERQALEEYLRKYSHENH